MQADIIDKLHPTVRARLTFVPVIIDPESVTAYIKEMGFEWEAKWAISKIFVYELLPACYNWIIQLDTDVMLVEDIRKLWDLQRDFDDDQLLGCAPRLASSRGAIRRCGSSWRACGM